jgi:predicted TIM-barrel fold metal-dependent hydrolase
VLDIVKGERLSATYGGLRGVGLSPDEEHDETTVISAHRRFEFPVFDADNHFYETREAFTSHLPDRYRGAIDYVDVRGRTKIAVKGMISDYIPNPTFDVIARPGAQEEYFRNGNPEGKSYREIMGEPMRCIPAFREPAARLSLMDEQGVDQTLLFPTLASLLEERMREDPELTHAVIHSFNEWLHETWTFNYANRIFPTPIVTLPVVDRAIAELEWVVERGAKAILIRPAPVPGYGGPRSFGLTEFDPFWWAVVESDVVVTLHASDSGYTRYHGDWMGRSEYLPFKRDALSLMLTMARQAVQDTAAALTCHGILSRFPALRVAFVENGGDWVGPFLERLADVYLKMPQGFDEDPVEAFKRNCYISPFHEDKLGEVIEAIGVDHFIFGSDFPHPEGLAEPTSFVGHLPPGLADGDLAKIMGGNLAKIMKVGVPV